MELFLNKSMNRSTDEGRPDLSSRLRKVIMAGAPEQERQRQLPGAEQLVGMLVC